MNIKKLLLIAFMALLRTTELSSCTCESWLSFCNFIKSDHVKVAFKAKVLMLKDYGNDNLALYLEIMHHYKSGIQTTDTIKVYGKEIGSSCALEVQNFSHGDTVIMALGQLDFFPIINPDSLLEYFSEFSPYYCDMVALRVHSGIINGWITEEVFEYPIELFDENLIDCSFSVDGEMEYLCPTSDELNVFPNPSVNGYLTLQSPYEYDSLRQMRVFAIDGRLVGDLQNLVGDPNRAIKIEIPGSGIYILEWICENRRYYKKVIVAK